ncbi:gliding motility protein [Streptomyces sp. H39-S7]|nr:gliding motility protein [Streptomyces sp. H39-S7]
MESVTRTAESEDAEAVAEPVAAERDARADGVVEPDAEPAAAGAAEPVGIPKQQSTADAADSEAGEGARA